MMRSLWTHTRKHFYSPKPTSNTRTVALQIALDVTKIKSSHFHSLTCVGYGLLHEHNQSNRKSARGETLNEIKLNYHFILCFYLSFFSFSPIFRSRVIFKSLMWTSIIMFLHITVGACVFYYECCYSFFPTAGRHSLAMATVLTISIYVKYSNALVKCDSNISRFTHSHLVLFSGIEKPLNLFFYSRCLMTFYSFLVMMLSVCSKNIFGCLFLYWKFIVLFEYDENWRANEKCETFTHS